MTGQGFGQRIAEARTAHVEGKAALPERMTDAPRRRRFLVQDDQDRLEHGGISRTKRVEFNDARGAGLQDRVGAQPP